MTNFAIEHSRISPHNSLITFFSLFHTACTTYDIYCISTSCLSWFTILYLIIISVECHIDILIKEWVPKQLLSHCMTTLWWKSFSWWCFINSIPLVPHICFNESDQHWFRYWLVAYSAPNHYPTLGYFQWDPLEQMSVKFQSKYKTYHSRKCVWKCLGNGGHFVQERCAKSPKCTYHSPVYQLNRPP